MFLRLVAGSRPAKDGAQDATDSVTGIARSVATIVVATVVVVTSILTEACVIALHKTLSESLRVGVLVVVRTLRAVALPTLRITGASLDAGLVSLVQRHLIAVVIAAVLVPVSLLPNSALRLSSDAHHEADSQH